ncbi:MAG: transcriptional regulator, GntR family [Solirubrobacterales bacterium]|jgi:DNA-binding transcriptional regulator YhcF (GntR family)|nr:transcriptional regulator, GntR family [Solirubrobacterales bacterium]
MATQQDQSTWDLSEISIDRAAEVPIGVQLAWVLRMRIQAGNLRPGQRLPGLRELAEATGVNVNTVKAVYQRLQNEGLIDTHQGSGTFVGATLRRPSDVAAMVANVAQEAHESGVDLREVAAGLYMSPGLRLTTDTASVRRRALRAQIASLERALGEIEAEHPGVAPPPSATRRALGPTLLGVEQLEQVRTQLVRRLAIVQAAIDEPTQTSKKPPPAKTRKSPQHSPTAKPKRTTRPRPTPRPASASS